MKETSKINLFILTTGLSGSSVMTGLIKQSDYWCGVKTEYKNNGTGQYETFENSDFVALNNKLIKLSGLDFDAKAWYQEQYRKCIADLYDTIDLKEFIQFSENCSINQPWVLKDPKLWLTVGFWFKVFKNQKFKVIILTRNTNQLWISQTNKRIIYDYQYLRHSEKTAQQNLSQFLEINNIDFLCQEYDELEKNTELELKTINKFLNSDLDLTAWNNIYRKKKGSVIPFIKEVKALLIYIKNYTLRIK